MTNPNKDYQISLALKVVDLFIKHSKLTIKVRAQEKVEFCLKGLVCSPQI